MREKDYYGAIKGFCLKWNLPEVWNSDRITGANLIYEVIKVINAMINELREYEDQVDGKLDVMKEMIDDFLKVFDENLDETVNNILIEWKDSGMLEGIINDALFNQKLDKSEFDVIKDKVNDKFTSVKEYGAKGDGVTDDTIAIKTTFENSENGDIVFFPKGIYLTSDTILINKHIKLDMQGQILANHEKVIILVKETSGIGNLGTNTVDKKRLDLEFNVRRHQTFVNDIQETIGVEICNVFSSNFRIKNILGNHIGLFLNAHDQKGSGYNAISYCNFDITLIDSRYKNILGQTTGDAWLSQNIFNGGSMTGAIASDSKNSVHISLINNGTSIINQNHFNQLSLEGNYKQGLQLEKANSNSFNDIRFELPKLHKVFIFEKESRFNIIRGSGYTLGIVEGKFDDNLDQLSSRLVTGTTITDQNYLTGAYTYYDGFFYVTPVNKRTSVGFDLVYKDLPPFLNTNWKKVIPKIELTSSQIGTLENKLDDTTLGVDVRYYKQIHLDEHGVVTTSLILRNLPDKQHEFTIITRMNAYRVFTIGTSDEGVIFKNISGVTEFKGSHKVFKFVSRDKELYLIDVK